MIQIKNMRNGFPNKNNEYDIRVDRKSVFGNPFYMNNEKERDIVCNKYEKYFYTQIKSNKTFKNEIDKLVNIYKKCGQLNLFCWCYPKRCHAETIKNYILNQGL